MGKRTLCGLVLVLMISVGVWGTAEAANELGKPNITGAEQKYFGSPNPEIDIRGTGFGSVQGTKNIQVDGTPVSSMPGWSVIRWSDTMVTIQSQNLIPWEHVYRFAVTDGETVVSNVFSKRFLYKFDGIKPNSGTPGTTVKVYIWGIPASPGGLVLKLGSYSFPVLSWTAGKPVEARVPSVPAGTYDVYLQKGSDVVSVKINFKVILLKPIPLKK